MRITRPKKRGRCSEPGKTCTANATGYGRSRPERIGIRPGRRRYDAAIEELEYEGAIEWDESARYARGTSTTSSPSAAWRYCRRARGS